MPFPHFIVADEIGDASRSKRSTLQLFIVDQHGAFHPIGPAHSSHALIAEKGNGAYSHWRQKIMRGSESKSMLRFSTPKNTPVNAMLKKATGMVAVVYPMVPPMGWIEFNAGGKQVNHQDEYELTKFGAGKKTEAPGMIAWNMVKCFETVYFGDTVALLSNVLAIGQLFVITTCDQELFREMFLRTFPTVGVSRPHLIDKAAETIPGTRYLWRVGGAHEFELPLQEGELYEKRLPYQIAEWYDEFIQRGGILYPPPETYIYYQNKVALAKLFNERKVKIPSTWVFSSLEEAEAEQDSVKFPVVIKDPYGYSSLGLMQAGNKEEFLKDAQRREKQIRREKNSGWRHTASQKVKMHFENSGPGVEAIVQSKVVALREARVTYIAGRPFHGYWRIRRSLKSASAASNHGGYQDFSFPLEDIAPYVAEFASVKLGSIGKLRKLRLRS
eukprot:g32491.t1